jgi:hypothetical protein
MAASVAARLLNAARSTGDDYETLLTAFAFERLLYRLGRSRLRDQFVLKGAMLLRVWSDRPYRATRDLDLLRRGGDASHEAVRAELDAVCATAVDPDGIDFDRASMRIESIRAEDEDAGLRARFLARCGSARVSLQVDMGQGDAVWPEPAPCRYPTLLDLPAPEILAYPREAVVAEKLEALIVLGDRNSRIKDFFDLHYLAGHFAFDRPRLVEAVRRTFARRSTPVPKEMPVGLTPLYWDNPSRPAQVRAFARRAGLHVPDDAGAELGVLLVEFLGPVLEDLRRGQAASAEWAPGGPWTSIAELR